MRILRFAAAGSLLIAAAACGSSGDDAVPTGGDTAPATSTLEPPATDPPVTEPLVTDAPDPTDATDPPVSEPAVTDAPDPTDPPIPTDAPVASDPPATEPPPTDPPATDPPSFVDVKVYLLRGERLAIAHRDVAGPAVLGAAIDQLMAGPTDDEGAAGLHSEIPDGTESLDVNLVEGLATVDLSAEYESGGGSLSMAARVAQVVFTATQFDNVDAVRFLLNGEAVEFLGGEGIVVGEPLTRTMTDRRFTGGVIVDTPSPGAEVRSPFTVTGEGDVYEGDFPIEVWRDGEQIGGVAPVMAGAWGDWADFEATVSLDAPDGPIDLVLYDAGGCGDDPECPEIIRTVLPLRLTR